MLRNTYRAVVIAARACSERQTVKYHARHNTYFKSLPALISGSGWLKYGISADPMFRDLSSGDVCLAEGSPCLDRGILLPGINEPFHGRAPDLGAFELWP